MIGVITVKVSAAKPSFPISTVPVFVGSDCTLAVGDVPSVFYGVRLTSVSVSITNADGATVTAVCVRSGVTWCATIPGAHFRVPGRVRAGLTVSACGTHEDGTTIGGWTLGRGDVEIMPADAVPAPGVAWQDVHLRDDEPEVPVKGDLAKVGGSWKIYTGAAWDPIGGGGGAVESVNGKKGAIVLDARDVGARPSDWTPTADDVGALPLAGGTLTGDLVIGDKQRPASRKLTVEADGGANGIQLIGGNVNSGSSMTIGGSSGNGGALVVEDGGSGNASIKKGGKEVATEDQLQPISAQSAYPIKNISDGHVKDRTVNVCSGGGEITFPDLRTDGCARDFVVRVPAMDTAPTVVFPSTVIYESWQDAGDIWTAESGKANEWYFSESEPSVFKVVHQALAVVSQS